MELRRAEALTVSCAISTVLGRPMSFFFFSNTYLVNLVVAFTPIANFSHVPMKTVNIVKN